VLRGSANLAFFNTSAVRMLENKFLDNFQMILQVLPFELPMRASLFLMVLKHVIPTQRGDHIFNMNSREVNCCDAEMRTYHRKTKQKLILSGIDQCAGCV
jgi:hypothetical protein